MTTPDPTVPIGEAAAVGGLGARGCRVDVVRVGGGSVLERSWHRHLRAVREQARAMQARDRLLAAVGAVITDCLTTTSTAAGVDLDEADAGCGFGEAAAGFGGSLEAGFDAELVVVQAVERAKAVLDAQAVTTLARMRAAADAMVAGAPVAARAVPVGPEELVVLEVATATGLGQREVAVRVELATGPVARFGRLRDLLAAGVVSVRRACELVEATSHLTDDDLVDQIVQGVFAPTRDGAGLSGSLFRQRLRRAVLRADTDTAAAAARRRAARARNGASAQVFDDGTGRLVVRNDAEKIAAAMDRADGAARAARAAGDPRSLDQLRADFLTGAAIYGQPGPGQCTDPACRSCRARPALDDTDAAAAQADADQAVPGRQTSKPAPAGESDSDHEAVPDGHPGAVDRTGPSDQRPVPDGRADQPAGRSGAPRTSPAGRCPATPGWFGCFGQRPPGRVWIVVPVTTMLGLDDAPCRLPGHGWVAAAQARAVITAPGSVWQTMLAEQHTGHAQQLSRAGYRPSAAMREHVIAVDGTCRGPGCTVPASQCDLDHDIPYPAGPTDVDHLSAKHRQHHRVRTAGFWAAVRDPHDASITWTTTAGRRYITYPTDWLADARPRRARFGGYDHNPEPVRRRYGPEPDPNQPPDPGPPPF